MRAVASDAQTQEVWNSSRYSRFKDLVDELGKARAQTPKKLGTVQGSPCSSATSNIRRACSNPKKLGTARDIDGDRIGDDHGES